MPKKARGSGLGRGYRRMRNREVSATKPGEDRPATVGQGDVAEGRRFQTAAIQGAASPGNAVDSTENKQTIATESGQEGRQTIEGRHVGSQGAVNITRNTGRGRFGPNENRVAGGPRGGFGPPIDNTGIVGLGPRDGFGPRGNRGKVGDRGGWGQNQNRGTDAPRDARGPNENRGTAGPRDGFGQNNNGAASEYTRQKQRYDTTPRDRNIERDVHVAGDGRGAQRRNGGGGRRWERENVAGAGRLAQTQNEGGGRRWEMENAAGGGRPAQTPNVADRVGLVRDIDDRGMSHREHQEEPVPRGVRGQEISSEREQGINGEQGIRRWGGPGVQVEERVTQRREEWMREMVPQHQQLQFAQVGQTFLRNPSEVYSTPVQPVRHIPLEQHPRASFAVNNNREGHEGFGFNAGQQTGMVPWLRQQMQNHPPMHIPPVRPAAIPTIERDRRMHCVAGWEHGVSGQIPSTIVTAGGIVAEKAAQPGTYEEYAKKVEESLANSFNGKIEMVLKSSTAKAVVEKWDAAKVGNSRLCFLLFTVAFGKSTGVVQGHLKELNEICEAALKTAQAWRVKQVMRQIYSVYDEKECALEVSNDKNGMRKCFGRAFAWGNNELIPMMKVILEWFAEEAEEAASTDDKHEIRFIRQCIDESWKASEFLQAIVNVDCCAGHKRYGEIIMQEATRLGIQ